MSAPTTSSDGFLLHGEPFRILSGAMHYLRVHLTDTPDLGPVKP
ncbi:hypothetical protein [Streptomyces apricus]|nr:hypothetical protein [Streptomyces apricus]